MITLPSRMAMPGMLLLSGVLLAGATGNQNPLAGMRLCSSAPALSASPANDAAPPAAQVKPLACEAITEMPGRFLVTAEVSFAPHARSGAHRHPGSVTAYVLRGTMRSQMAGEVAKEYHSGQSWFEPAGMVHLLAENTGDTPAVLLASFVVEGGCGPLVLPA